jgi:segregation and condensation protein B
MIKEENINCTLEALILSSPEPVPVKRLCEVMDDISAARVRQAVDDLNNLYMGCGGSFRIRELAGGFQMYVLPDFEQAVKRLLTKQRTIRLSQAALETLAIIAYKQPVTKTDIEHIRGVACDGVLHNLLERRLILMAGRSDGPGRPLLYRTTQDFLKFFGLNRLSDLPRMDEIEEMIRQASPSQSQTVLPLSEPDESMESSLVDGESADGGNGNGNGNGDREHILLSPFPDELMIPDDEIVSDTPMPMPEIAIDEDPGAELDDELDEEEVSPSEAAEDPDAEARRARWAQVFAPDEAEDDVPAGVLADPTDSVPPDDSPDISDT